MSENILTKIKQLETEVEEMTVAPSSPNYIEQFKKRLAIIHEIDRLYLESKYWSDKRVGDTQLYE